MFSIGLINMLEYARGGMAIAGAQGPAPFFD
jgi:hypothetical protein